MLATAGRVATGRALPSPAVKLFVVRHGNAGSRSEWAESDRTRPLSPKGWRQAAGIADSLADEGIKRLVSSPATRCIETLEPLAKRLGLPIEQDERLLEGARVDDAMALLRELDGDTVALCSHGDVIPDLLDALRVRDAKHKGPMLWAKGSTWELKIDGDRATKARYMPPSA